MTREFQSWLHATASRRRKHLTDRRPRVNWILTFGVLIPVESSRKLMLREVRLRFHKECLTIFCCVFRIQVSVQSLRVPQKCYRALNVRKKSLITSRAFSLSTVTNLRTHKSLVISELVQRRRSRSTSPRWKSVV